MHSIYANNRQLSNAPYVPTALRSGLGFRSAYAAPVARPRVDTAVVAAALNYMAGVAATTIWVASYQRGGRTVNGYCRRRQGRKG